MLFQSLKQQNHYHVTQFGDILQHWCHYNRRKEVTVQKTKCVMLSVMEQNIMSIRIWPQCKLCNMKTSFQHSKNTIARHYIFHTITY